MEVIAHRLRVGRAFWRTAPFAELVELYSSRFLRNIGQSLVSSFVAVFLYQQGYSLVEIFLFLVVYYILRTFVSFIGAYIVAWLGPKTTMLISNLLAIPAMVALSMLEAMPLQAALGYFLFEAFSVSLASISTDVHFSSIRRSEKAGKQLGWLNIMEKVGTGLSPLAGGLIAYVFGPQSIIFVATILMIISALPLFLTPEKTRRRQRVMYQGLPYHKIRRNLFTYVILGVNQVASGVIWMVFISLTIFGMSGNSVYAKIGIFISIAFVTSLIVTRVYGVLIDRRKGHRLLGVGSALASLVHAARPFVATPFGVGAVNVVNEIGISAANMPYASAYLDRADKLPGYRATYVSLMMIFFCSGATLMALCTVGLLYFYGEVDGLKYSFFVAAGLVWLVRFHGFSSLRRRA